MELMVILSGNWISLTVPIPEKVGLDYGSLEGGHLVGIGKKVVACCTFQVPIFRLFQKERMNCVVLSRKRVVNNGKNPIL